MSRATQAKQILQNKLFQESIQELKKIYSNALFEQTGAKDGEAREKLWLAYQVLGKVQQHFKEIRFKFKDRGYNSYRLHLFLQLA